MEYIDFPEQQLRIPRFSLGTWAFSGARVWGEADTAEAVATIHAALDQGLYLIDSAEAYGDGKAEAVVGEAIHDRRSQVLLASKVAPAHMAAADVIAACEASLQRLRTDCIDIYQIHWPSRTIPMAETIGALEKLIAQGKIRHISVCNFNEAYLQQFVAITGQKPLMNQLPYNAVWRMAERFMPADAAEAARNDSLLRPAWAYSPLAQGLLTGKYRTLEEVPIYRRENRLYSCEYKLGRHTGHGFEKQIFEFLGQLLQISAETGLSVETLSINWLKTQKPVASILIGSRSRQQLADNLAAYETVVPTEISAKVDALSRQLRSQMGPNPDLWEGGDEGGGRFD